MELEQYTQTVFVKNDEQYEKITNVLKEIGMPTISVAPETGKLLTLLVKMTGAKKLLEVGALGGYSGICLLRGTGENGSLTSLELSESYANVAKQHVEEAGYEGQVSYKIGPAQESLNELVKDDEDFDFFFIDADKENYLNYLDLCVKLSKPGAIIAGDNTFWGGKVIDASAQDGDTKTLRAFNEAVANHPRLESLIIPIGDGLTIARVID